MVIRVELQILLVNFAQVAMAVTFHNVNLEAGLQKLDQYLLTRSYITG